jgi:serine/threonine-protein kinase
MEEKRSLRPIDAVILAEEAARARNFLRVTALVTVVLGAFLPFLPGPSWLRGTAFATTLLVIAMSLVGLAIVSRDYRYTPRFIEVYSAAFSAAAIAIIYYLGLFSAAAAVLTVVVYFFGLSRSRLAAVMAYVLVAAAYLVLSAGIASNLIVDHGLVSVAGAAELSRWYRVAMMQLVLGVTFYLAQSSRRATDRAIERAQQIRHALKQRDALLAEARGELDFALRAGEGHMSGQVAGGYLLGDLLGRGAMGEVYEATQEASGRRVALKLLHANMLENTEYVQRFLREAQAAAAVPSEHVAQVYEVGFLPQGGPFIAMELLEGHDLAWHLRKHGSLDLPTVQVMVEHAARALAAVRDAGVVHRDLKPANLFLVDALPHKWKVLDFGLSKIQGGVALTRDVAVGTPQYMAPEQAQGLVVDHRADLYALAAIAYRAITGQPPFVGEDIGPLLLDVIYTQPQQPGLFAKLPVEVELVLAIALSKKPDDRFGSVEELAEAFRLAVSGELDETTRMRGWQLVKRHPWGTSARRGRAA